MIISTKGRYALKLMMYLAKKNSAEFVPLKFISAQQNIPLEAVLEELDRRSHKIGNLKQFHVADHNT